LPEQQAEDLGRGISVLRPRVIIKHSDGGHRMSTTKAMRKTLIIVAALALGLGAAPRAEEWKPLQTFEVGTQATSISSMEVIRLRNMYCGGEPPGAAGFSFMEANQDAKNAAFVGCVMYVLGVVDMLREWQKIDPMHALHICVPRTASSGQLILVVQEHIEATTPWQQGQSDAATAVIAALEAKWPCPRGAR
jgi:hypothetical protein